VAVAAKFPSSFDVALECHAIIGVELDEVALAAIFGCLKVKVKRGQNHWGIERTVDHRSQQSF
jgi:hypothetical protein